MLGSPEPASHTDWLRLCPTPKNGARPEPQVEQARTFVKLSHGWSKPTNTIVIPIPTKHSYNTIVNRQAGIKIPGQQGMWGCSGPFYFVFFLNYIWLDNTENENENSLNNILPSKKEKEKKKLNEVFQLEWCRITCFFIFRNNKYIESWWLAKRVILYIK